MRRTSLVCALVAASLSLGACKGSGDDASEGENDPEKYKAEIRWTGNAIPHIVAEDVPSVAFGQGWAFARLNACILADQVVKVRGERSMFYGPGEENANVDSDFVHRFLDFRNKGIEAFENQSDEVQGLIEGYVAGYNAYITGELDKVEAIEMAEEEELPQEDIDMLPTAELPCVDEPWMQPIAPEDLMAHYIELTTLASSRALTDFIATAEPPVANLEREPGPDEPKLADLQTAKPGSNGWGIGRDRSASRGGMVMANPHFPWEGELKLYESHLTVPGELDVYGASLMGVVGVLIGFNDAVAWTHTVSAGHRFTFYVLELDPDDPTSYMYDGMKRKMEPTAVTIDVLGSDGSVSERTRTLWRSHYGPVVSIPDLGYWNMDMTLAFRDANENNTNLISQFHDMNKAKSMDEFIAAHANNQGIPWVNTMSASADGRAWYIDSTPTPNLSDAALTAWDESEDFVINAVRGIGAVALDGSTSVNEWIEEEGARSPGLVPFARMPQIERSDFIFNANDSYWLSNPLQPLTGFSPMHGEEGTPRTPRTRMNATILMDTGPDSPAGPDGLFDLDDLSTAALSNRGMMAELLRDAVVDRCEDVEEWGGVNIEDVCKALEEWDLLLDLDSAGALAWREFLGDFDFDSLKNGDTLWLDLFLVDDPIGTPRNLSEEPPDIEEDRILEALAGAATRLAAAGLSPTDTLRTAQFTLKGQEAIPIHGGGRFEGTTNLIQYDVLKTTVDPPLARGDVLNEVTDLTTDGYVVNYGTSFIMAMQFTPSGPEARAFLTYGQSGDVTSPFYSDQTRAFSKKEWRTILFREADILADPGLEVQNVVGGDL